MMEGEFEGQPQYRKSSLLPPFGTHTKRNMRRVPGKVCYIYVSFEMDANQSFITFTMYVRVSVSFCVCVIHDTCACVYLCVFGGFS